MNITAKKVISILIMLSVVSSAAACGDSGTAAGTGAQETAAVTDAPAAEETTEDSSVHDGLPELDFGGETVTIHARGDSNAYGEIYAELDGEVLNDAIYNRNRKVEEQLNVTIDVFKGPVWSDYYNSIPKLQSTILAGDDSYQIIAGWAAYAPTMALEGCFMNLNSLPYLDISKPWWTQSATKGMNVLGMLFFVTGDVSIITDLGGSFGMYLNDNVAENYGVTGIVSDVYDGVWTLDKLIASVSGTGNDMDGDGKRGTEDMYGLILDLYNSADAFLTASDIHQIVPDEKGNLVYVDQTERLTRMMEKIYPLYYGDGYNSYMNSDAGKGNQMFASGHGMLTVRQINATSNEFRPMEDSYTIIPLPKLDENQKDYMVCSFNGATIWGIPISNSKPDASLAVMEAMGCLSYNTVTPVYFETCLQDKLARNEDTLKMLEIIRDNMYLDSENLYRAILGDTIFAARNMMSSKKSDVASYTAKNAPKIEQTIAETIAKFNELRERGY